MSVRNLIKQALDQGVYLSVVDNRLKFASQRGGLTDELREQLKDHKQAIIEYLSRATGKLEHRPVKSDSSLAKPLSFSQQRLWFLDQVMGPSAVYNMSLILQLDDSVRIDDLKLALQRVWRRHDVLRTRFIENDDVVEQIAEQKDLNIEADQFESLVEAHTAIAKERVYTFTLEEEVLSRVRLFTEREENNRFLTITLHHAISDGWSMGVLLKELQVEYGATIHQSDASLPELPFQYGDFAKWQRDPSVTAELKPQIDYWREYLAGIPAVLDFPFDRARPAKQRFVGQTLNVSLSKTTATKVRALTQASEATLFMTLISAFAVLMSRYSRQRDIVIGTPVANRTEEDLEGLIGFFANTLVLRHDLSSNPSFEELLGKTKEDWATAYANQDAPFDRLVEELCPERSLSYSPVFQVMFSVQNAPINGEGLEQLGIKPAALPADQTDSGGTSRFDMTWSLSETIDGPIDVSIEFNTDLFDQATILQLVDHYEILLGNIATSPDVPVMQLDMMSTTEPQPIEPVSTVVAGENEFAFIHTEVEKIAESRPERTALVFRSDDGEECHLSYGELNSRANKLAHVLRSKGAGPEVKVALCFGRSLDMIIALLAVVKAGAAYVPIDIRNPASRIEYIVNDSDAQLLIAGSTALEINPELAQIFSRTELDTLSIRDGHLVNSSSLSTEIWPCDDNIDVHQAGLKHESLAYVIYTSGTTGNPKGVLVEHRNIPRLFDATRREFDFDDDDVWTLFHSYAFDFSVWEIWGALAHGAKLIVVDDQSTRSLEQFYDQISEESVTILSQTPTVFSRVVNIDIERKQRLALRRVVFGGEALDMKSLTAWFARHSTDDVTLINMYGITETTVHVTQYRVTEDDSDGLGGSPIGRPIDDLEIFLFDEFGKPVPEGVTGEIYVGGAGVSRGYHERPTLTQERFIPHPTRDGETLYRSGDLARCTKDGNLIYIGRADTQVKIRGFRIELGEITNALFEHEDVRDAATDVWTDPKGEKHIVGYAVTDLMVSDDAEIECIKSIRNQLASKLPAYMVPSNIMLLDELPQTVNGKLDRERLPRPTDIQEAREFSPPKGDIEEALAAIWMDLLKRDRVDRHASFFALGGHSLLVGRLSVEIRKQLDVELSIETLFEAQTLADQAELVDTQANDIDAAQNEAAYTLDLDEAWSGKYELSLGQERLVFLQDFMGPNAVYNIPLAMAFEGSIYTANFVNALRTVIGRHDTLRTRFMIVDDEVQAVVHPNVNPIRVEVMHSHEEVLDAARSERAYEFDLNRDNLCRIRVIQNLSNDSLVLLVTMHHAISDGQSVGIFMSELLNTLSAFNEKRLPNLPEQKAQYQHYAKWQREWVKSAAHRRQLQYWKEQLFDLPEKLTLPYDYPRPEEQSFKGRFESIALSADLSSAVTKIAQRYKATPFMVLLSAYSLLLARYSGQADIAVGTPIANRQVEHTDNVVGYFVNTIVLRTDVNDAMTYPEYLANVRQTALDGYAHQSMPFERLVEEINPVRNPSHTPLFQAMFALQNMPEDSVSMDGYSVCPLKESLADYLAEGESIEDGVSRFDLTLTMHEASDHFCGGIEYNTDVFARTTIERFANDFALLLEQIARDSSQTLSAYQVVSLSEQQRQLAFISNSGQMTQHSTLLETMNERVLRTPDADAIECTDSLGIVTRYSYLTVDTCSERIAKGILTSSGSPTDPVVIAVKNPVLAVMALLASIRAGVQVVIAQPDQPLLRFKHLIESSSPRVLLVDDEVSDSLIYQAYFADSEIADSCPMIDVRVAVLDSALSPTYDDPVGEPIHADGALIVPSFDTDGVAMSLPHSKLAILAEQENGIADVFAQDQFQREIFGAIRSFSRGECFRTSTALGNNAVSPNTVNRCHSGNSLILSNERSLVPRGTTGTLYVCVDALKVHNLLSDGLVSSAEVDQLISSGSLIKTPFRARYNNTNEIEFWRGHDLHPRSSRAMRESVGDQLASHERVENHVVVMQRNLKNGQDASICYVIPAQMDDSGSLRDALYQRFCNAEIMMPLPDHIVAISEFPLTADGTVDEKALPSPKSTQVEYVPPRTDVERVLCSIWEQQLNRERVGINDNYFLLGGDSIRSLSMVSEARAQGYTIASKDLFTHSTIRELSEVIVENGNDSQVEREVVPFELLTEKEYDALIKQVDVQTLEDAFPLSLMQQGMVTLALQYPELNLYENLQVYRLSYQWDQAKFTDALNSLVEKHAMLRSVYELSGERSIQKILKVKPVALDVRQIEDEARATDILDEWMAHEKSTGIDTSKELWRCTVHVQPNGHFDFGMFVHHALWDGWSLESFVTELYTEYAARLFDQPTEPQAPLPSYANYIALEQASLQSETQRKHWQDMLGNAQLPWWTGHPKTSSEHLICDISKADSQVIVELARELGVQEKSIWCAVYFALLAVLDGSQDVTACVITQARPEIAGSERLIGLFLNALPLRATLVGSSWTDFIRAVDASLRHQHEYRSYPVAQIQQDSSVDLSGALFTYTNWHVYGDAKKQSEEAVGPEKVGGWAETNYGLSVIAYKDEQAQQYGLSIHADTGIFDSNLRRRMRGYAMNIVRALVSNPFALINKTALLDSQERTELLETGVADTSNVLPTTVLSRFEQHVENQADAIAVVFDDEQLSYGELDRRSNALATQLLPMNIQSGDRICIYMQRSANWIVSVLATLKLRAAYVPVDASQPESRARFIAEDSAAKVLLVDEVTQHRIGTEPVQGASVLSVENLDTDLLNDDYHAVKQVVGSVLPNDLAYIIYTSGTTGKPKGVQIEHQNIPRLFTTNEADFAFAQGDIWTLFHSLAFDFSVWEIWGPLLYGGKLIVVPERTTRAPDSFYRLLVNQCVTVLSQTPTMFKQVDAVDQQEGAPLSLRLVVFGGEALDVGGLSSWFERRGNEPVSLINMYGITETTVHVTHRRITSEDAKPGAASTIGRPLNDLEVYLLDEQQSLVPQGIAGEICVGGAGLARGYLNRPSLTEKKFVAHPFKEGERLYRSGDLARQTSTGELEYLGRLDNQVKIRGFRIELGEIESTLRSVPGVGELIVVVQNDEEGHKRLVSYFVANSETSANDQELREEIVSHAERELPVYMVPSAVVGVDTMPLTSNGKIDFNALPKPGRENFEKTYVAPRTSHERALCEVMQDVLNLDRVGIHDNFFTLGGDSILAVRAVAKAREHNISISIRRLFEAPNIAELAKTEQGDSQPDTTDASPFALLDESEMTLLDDVIETLDDAYPMSELQLAMVFHSQVNESGFDYLNVMSVETEIEWNNAAFHDALKHLMATHPVLRTTFRLDFQRPLQLVHQNLDVPLTVNDVRHLDSDAQEVAIQQWFDENLKNNYDWEKPLFNVTIFVRSDNVFQFCNAHHHAMYDGWSDASFMASLFGTYQRLIDGETLPAAISQNTFRDFVALERQALELGESKKFWGTLLQEASSTQLPTVNSGVESESDERSVLKYSVPGFGENGELIVKTAKHLGVPVQSLLLAVHSKVISTLSGQKNVVSSVVVNGRPESDGGDTGLGLFLNAVPMSFACKEGTWRELIADVNKTFSDCLAHRWYPATVIQRDVGKEFNEILFNYGHFHALANLSDESEVGFRNFKGFEQTSHGASVHFVRSAAGDHIECNIAFDTTRFDRRLIERMGRYYCETARSLLLNLDTRHSDVSLLSDVEREALLISSKPSPSSKNYEQCVHTLFENMVNRQPNSLALQDIDDQGIRRSLTYDQVNRYANQVAHGLLVKGLKPENPVGVMMDRSAAMVICMLGIMKAGGTYVGIDPDHPKDRINSILESLSPKVIFTDQADYQEFARNKASSWVVVGPKFSVFKHLPDSNISTEQLGTLATSACYILYTSGSSGSPKGVIGTHRALVNRLNWYARVIGVDSTDIHCQKTSVGFVDHVAEILQAISFGAALIVVPKATLLDPTQFMKLLDDYRVSQLTLVPSLLNATLENVDDDICLQHLKVINCSGESLRLSSQSLLSKHMPNAELINLYGSTEIGADATSSTVDLSKSLSVNNDIGVPINNLRAYVLNSNLELVPPGCIGELCIAGDGLSRGYFNEAGMTASAFIPDPFSSSDSAGERLYMTGDLVQVLEPEEGGELRLLYLGRMDRQVKVRGARVELGEIERTLCSSEQVSQAVVELRDLGGERSGLIAYVVSNELAEGDDATALVKELKKIATDRLANYMLPVHYEFLDTLPLNANGKLDRAQLPEIDLTAIGQPFEAPSGEIETTLARLWAETLECEKVGRHDNFFSMGGHSILAIQLIAQINAELGVNYKVGDLFSYPTPQALGQQIELLRDISSDDIFDSLTEEEAEKLLAQISQ